MLCCHEQCSRYIRGEAEKTSCVVRDIGNVTKGSEITFEYGVRRADKYNGITVGCIACQLYIEISCPLLEEYLLQAAE